MIDTTLDGKSNILLAAPGLGYSWGGVLICFV